MDWLCISKYCPNDKASVDGKEPEEPKLEKYFADSFKMFSGCPPPSGRTSSLETGQLEGWKHTSRSLMRASWTMLSEGVTGDKFFLGNWCFPKCCGTAMGWGYWDLEFQHDEKKASTGHRNYYIQGIVFFGNAEFQTSMPGSSGSWAEE